MGASEVTTALRRYGDVRDAEVPPPVVPWCRAGGAARLPALLLITIAF